MDRARHPWLRAMFLLAAAPFAAVVLWLAAAFGLGAIAVNTPPAATGPGIDLYLLANDWHVDLVVPVAAAGIDWRREVPLDGIGGVAETGHIAFGWGDRAFYLETRRLADFRLGTALSALTGRGPAVLHLTMLDRPVEGAGVRRLTISPESYRALAGRLAATFDRDGAGRPRELPGAGYGPRDLFVAAAGHYSPFQTCNEWLARQLRAVGLPAGAWAPLPSGLTAHWPAS